MDSWPSSSTFAPNLQNAKGKTKDKLSRRCYPNLESGMTGAITLVEQDGRLKWGSIFNGPFAGE